MKAYEDIEKVVIKTYLLGIRMDSREVASEASLDAGQQWNFEYSVAIPGIAPSATYAVQMEVMNAEDVVIKCISIDLKL